MKRLFNIFILLLMLAALTPSAHAQIDEGAPVKIDTLLYTIPLTVTDQNGHHVKGLKKENFSITQDGEKQQIDFFFNEEAPMNVAILIDSSGSTRPVLSNIQEAARDFIKVFRPGDKGIIASFDNRTSILSEFTSDRKKLSDGINRVTIAAQDGSDMNDAVFKIIQNYFAQVKGRKAIIVLTDGLVSGKNIPNYKVTNLLRDADTFLYPIIFKSSTYFIRDSRAPNAKIHLPYEPLQQMADESLGMLYVKDRSNLHEAFESISEDLKKQYLIGYYPQNNRPPDQIKINVDRKNLKIKTKKARLFDQ